MDAALLTPAFDGGLAINNVAPKHIIIYIHVYLHIYTYNATNLKLHYACIMAHTHHHLISFL